MSGKDGYSLPRPAPLSVREGHRDRDIEKVGRRCSNSRTIISILDSVSLSYSKSCLVNDSEQRCFIDFVTAGFCVLYTGFP